MTHEKQLSDAVQLIHISILTLKELALKHLIKGAVIILYSIITIIIGSSILHAHSNTKSCKNKCENSWIDKVQG